MKVSLIDWMGSDVTVAQSARVSFDKKSEQLRKTQKKLNVDGRDIWYGIEEVDDKDAKLISYLARNNHWTPFSHTSITLRETVPLLVARQRFKHTVGFTYNEVSRRYVDTPPEFEDFIWRKRHENAKQGSADEFSIDMQDKIDELYDRHMADCLATYNAMLDMGVCPEQARSVLPQSMMTSYYVTGSLAAFARAYNLRAKPDAQREIQDVAYQWNSLVSPLFPVAWKELTGC